MELLGDLERAFATSLYPLRVPIAIGLTIALVLLLVVARRRGWFAAARRHPARTAAALVVFLAVAGPVGWYLGSPLFIRTSLVEPAPSAGSGPVAPGPTAGAGTPAPTSAVPGGSALPSAAPSVSLAAERRGTFEGADDFHFASGTARLIETAPGVFVVRFEGFSVRNGPNLHVYLSPDPQGHAKDAVDLGELKATDGDFNTAIPAGTNVAAMRSVYIWCKQFAVQFAVATLR